MEGSLEIQGKRMGEKVESLGRKTEKEQPTVECSKEKVKPWLECSMEKGQRHVWESAQGTWPVTLFF
ncbi:hypothetical protein Pyn_36108 [Prunus yedoensis var. nudiflora]|uniref:Uncharacterized protein n=1 Tax=Prunus yedoensis var. nudiflora TaxID=2094558 RepID=A0A314YF22_PRUYE|nr:hypothetical protein Pyn_36108 [Prunus yedoensis var. nudiflora]